MKFVVSVLLVAVSSVGSLAWAAGASAGVSSVSGGSSDGGAISSVREARDMVGTSGLPALKLGLSASEQAEVSRVPFRFFSSIEMKRRFEPVISKLVLDERLGAPLQFDPGKSAYEHRQMMFKYRKLVCDKALMSVTSHDVRTDRVVGGDAAFLNEMQGLSPRLLKSVDSAAALSPAVSAKLVAGVNAQLAAASSALKGENPSKVLGALQSVDAFGGEHFRLHFANLKAEVSLPMMISFMTLQDSAFVRVLDCASHHLSDLMKDKATHDKYFGMSPVRLADTLRAKGLEAREANRLLSRLSVPQLRVMMDTLLQLDAAAVKSPAELSSAVTSAAKSGSNESAARVEFLQYINRELGDYRDTKRSVHLLRAQSSK